MSYTLEVWDILGQKVFAQRVNSELNQFKLNAESWAPGTYQLIIKNETGYIYQQHLVKQGATTR
jgi:hypothetical protein